MTPTEHSFASFDGQRIAWRELGEGRPVILFHGLFSSAFINWIRYGHAAAVAERGFRVIMPDLRAHGDSARPHDPAAYPPGVLARDGSALIEHLGLADYDLGGYSLGARTSMNMVIAGAGPGKLVLGGMGLQGTLNLVGRAAHFRKILTNLGSFERGTPEWNAEAFLKTTKGDPEALLLLLDSFTDTREADLQHITMPTLVVTGDEDADNGSAELLVEHLPNARLAEIPGGHMSSVTKPQLGLAIADFLAAD